jgi:hypothetical protein
MRRWFRAGFALFGSFLIGSASAETLSSARPADHYQEAMQALSEGRIDDARTALAILIENEPDNPGAWLDLATLRCSVGDAAEAERLFEEIESRFSPPPAIIEIINQQRAMGCAGRKNRAPAQSLVRLGRGYDGNANQGVSNPNFSIGSGSNRVDLVVLPAYLPASDHYSALSVDYLSDLPGLDSTSGLVQFRARKYDRLSAVDSASVMAGVERSWRSGDWRLRGVASAGVTTLGGSPYLNQGQLQIQAQPPVSLPAGWQFTLVGGWSYLFYPSFHEYNGNVFEARSALRFYTENGGWQASAGALLDQQVNQRPGGDRRGYFASIDGRFRLQQWGLAELGWQHQQWQASTIFSPGLIDLRRKQDTQVLRASLTIPLATNHSLLAEYQYTNNRENISIFEYKGQLIQLSWQYQLGK